MIDPHFKTFLTGQLIKKLEFSPSNNKLMAIMGDDKSARAALYKEGATQYNYSQKQVNEFIMQVISESVELNSSSFQATAKNPAEIPLGQHIKLTHQGTSGKVEEELFTIGKNEFLLVRHDRYSLNPGTILKSISSPWGQGHELEFNYTFEETVGIYRMGKILNIEMLAPNDTYRAIQEKLTTKKKTKLDFSNQNEGPSAAEINRSHRNIELAKETKFFYPETENLTTLDSELFSRMQDKDSLFSIKIQGDFLYMRLLNLDQKAVVKLFFRKNDALGPIFNIQGRDAVDLQKVLTITSAKFEKKHRKWQLVNKGNVIFKGK